MENGVKPGKVDPLVGYPSIDDVELRFLIGHPDADFCKTSGCVYADNDLGKCNAPKDCGYNGYFVLKSNVTCDLRGNEIKLRSE